MYYLFFVLLLRILDYFYYVSLKFCVTIKNYFFSTLSMVLDSIFSARNSSKVMTIYIVRILAMQKRGLKVVLINAQSLNNKVDEFRYVFENSDVDIV